MRNVRILTADSYRMIDALRDYADILAHEGSSLADSTRRVADNIEKAERIVPGFVAVEQFDLDAAQSAAIGVMVERRERAEALRAEAEALEVEAMRYERLLEAF